MSDSQTWNSSRIPEGLLPALSKGFFNGSLLGLVGVTSGAVGGLSDAFTASSSSSAKGFPGDRESEGGQSGLAWAAGLATVSMEGDVFSMAAGKIYPPT